MSFLYNILMVVQILSAFAMIGLVLVQHGKGADMGAAFGSGSSGSLFGASGSANFLSRTTAVLATVFFAATLLLAYFANPSAGASNSVLSGLAAPVASAPAAVTASAPASQAGLAEKIPTQTAPVVAASAPAVVAASAPVINLPMASAPVAAVVPASAASR